MTTVYILLAIIFGVVLFVPFLFKAVEARLEFFLLLAGIASVSASHSWSPALLTHATEDPLPITGAVLLASVIFQLTFSRMERITGALAAKIGERWMAFFLVAFLGLIAGLVTALIAALALSEAVMLLRLKRASQVRLVVLGCFAIGLGAVLTPLGEPLASITVARIRGGAHAADFWFLFRLLGAWIVPLIVALAVAAWFLVEPGRAEAARAHGPEEPYSGLMFRAFKVYVFVVGLELLGAGFNPATGDLLKSMPAWALYWASAVSAVLDNASLAAAGLSPDMSAQQLRYFMLGLMISGGSMVPGNFPNIVCAGKLKIGFKEWAAIGIPVCGALMAAVFILLLIFPAT